jgi:hypothetical protein
VILDPQQHVATVFPRVAPDVFSVENVAEMQPAGGRWGEAGTH